MITLHFRKSVRGFRNLFFLLSIAAINPGRAEVVMHLFTDWYGVDAGRAAIKVDRSKVAPEILNVIEQVKDYYKIEVADGDAPVERVSVPVGVALRAEVAKKVTPLIPQDKPWETGGVSLIKVVQDGGLYRVWYYAWEKGSQEPWSVVVLPNGRKKLGGGGTREGSGGFCYMESRDAVTWTKPSFGLVKFRGSKENNIIEGPRGGFIFIDRQAPPDERYKSVLKRRARDFDPKAPDGDTPALEGAISPDGIHWTILPKPISNWKGAALANDGSAEVYRDEQTGRYVMFTRANYPRRRSIARASTDDFRNWRDLPEIILTPGPDEPPTVDFYDHPYVYYPGSASSHLMLVSSFHRDTSRVDIRLGSSMDGSAWNWLSPRAVVPLGRLGDWDGGQLYAYGDMVRFPDGRVAVGFTGHSDRHEDDYRSRFHRDRVKIDQSAWAVWNDGRVAGVEAAQAGEFTTLPFVCTGNPIEINARIGPDGAGFVRADVLVDELGWLRSALEGKRMVGDLPWRKLEFANGNISSLAGKTVRLQFQLYDAKVFGFRAEGAEWVSSYGRK